MRKFLVPFLLIFTFLTTTGFRFHEKPHIVISSDDIFGVEDASSDYRSSRVTLNDIVTYLDQIYQPFSYILLSIANDETIDVDLDNSAYPWTDDEISDNITIGSGGTISLSTIQAACSNDFHNIGGVDDDQPDIGTGLIYDSQILKVSTTLQKYHAIDLSSDVQDMLGSANDTSLRTEIGCGTAATRNAEDTLTDGSNLPDGHAIKTYGDANWGGEGVPTKVVCAYNSVYKTRCDYICDGVDDDVEIQEAIDSITKGKIKLTEGDYIISNPIIIKELIWIMGQGEKITTIHASPGFNGNMFEFNSANVTDDYQYEFYISDLFGSGFEGGANCQFLDTENQHPTGTQWLQDVKLFNVAALGFKGTNTIHIKPAWGFRGIGLCIEVNSGNGIYIEGGQNPSSAKIRGSQIHSNNGCGVVFENVENSVIIDNELNGGTDKFAVEIGGGSSINVIGNVFLGGGATSGGHVYLRNSTGANNIIGNQFSGSTTTAYGVRIAPGSESNNINNNQFSYFTIAEIDDLGTDTIQIGNASLSVEATRKTKLPHGLYIVGTDTDSSRIVVNSPASNVDPSLFLTTGNATNEGGQIWYDADTADVYFDKVYAEGAGNIYFRSGDNKIVTFLDGGNVGIGTTSPNAKLDVNGTIGLLETTAPSATAGHGFIYSANVSGTTEVFAMDGAGNAPQLTPHNFALFEPDPDELYPWSYYAENKALGIKINVDMAGVVRAVEELTGKKFVYYEDIPATIDLEKQYKEKWINKYIKDNTYKKEVSKDQAFETVENEVDDKTEILRYEQDGYELNGTKVNPKLRPVYTKKTIEKVQLKSGVEFDGKTGKFYKIVKPNREQAELAAETGFKFSPPKWLDDRLKNLSKK